MGKYFNSFFSNTACIIQFSRREVCSVDNVWIIVTVAVLVNAGNIFRLVSFREHGRHYVRLVVILLRLLSADLLFSVVVLNV